MEPDVMRCWLQQVIGLGESMCARAMAIIRNDAFRDALVKFTSTPYGQKHFQWSPMEMIINTIFWMGNMPDSPPSTTGTYRVLVAIHIWETLSPDRIQMASELDRIADTRNDPWIQGDLSN